MQPCLNLLCSNGLQLSVALVQQKIVHFGDIIIKAHLQVDNQFISR